MLLIIFLGKYLPIIYGYFGVITTRESGWSSLYYQKLLLNLRHLSLIGAVFISIWYNFNEVLQAVSLHFSSPQGFLPLRPLVFLDLNHFGAILVDSFFFTFLEVIWLFFFVYCVGNVISIVSLSCWLNTFRQVFDFLSLKELFHLFLLDLEIIGLALLSDDTGDDRRCVLVWYFVVRDELLDCLTTVIDLWQLS